MKSGQRRPNGNPSLFTCKLFFLNLSSEKRDGVDQSSLNDQDKVVAIIMCSGAIEILGRRSRMKQTKLDAGGALEELLRAVPQTRK